VRDDSDPNYVARWHELSGLPTLPRHPLTAPLLALMLDSNPRPHTRAKSPPPWALLAEEFDWPLWADALDLLLAVLAEAQSAQEFKNRLQQEYRPVELRSKLKPVLDELGHFQSF
jgi:hypothetical protein